MGDKLVLKDDVLRRGHASLVAAKGDFDQVQDRANDAADACGYGPLATVLRDSSSDWQLRRGKLAEALESLAGHMKKAIDGFEHWDVVNRDGMKPENPSAPAPNPPALTVTGQTQQGRSDTTSTGTQAPLSVQGGGGGAGGGAGAGGTAGPPPPVPPAVPGFTDHPGALPTPPRDLVTGVPVPTPDRPEVVPGSPGIITDSVQLKDANLEQLIHALTDRWTKLGGDEKAVLAALAGIGVAGGVAGVAGVASGGGSSTKTAGSAAGTSTVPTGEQAATTGVAGANAPAGLTGGTQTDAAAQGQPVVIAPEPGVAVTEGSETAPEDPRAAAPVEAPSALTDPGSATSADAPPAADTSGSSLGQPSAPGASDVPEAPPALPGLTSDAADGAGATGADLGSASAPEPLPPLGGGSSTASVDLPAASSSLPSLASAPVGQAEATMAAAAVPLGASMLHQGGQGAAPVGGVAGAALPSLSGSSGRAAASGGEVRRGTEESAVQDANRILADLSNDSGKERH